MCDTAPTCGDGAAHTTPTRILLDRLNDEVARRLGVQDAAVADLERALEGLAENLGRRIEAALGGSPTGETAFEMALDGLSDAEQVRVAVLATQLDDLREVVRDAGLDEARAGWLRRYGQLADMAEQALARAGVDRADGALDREAVADAIDALIDRHDEAIFSGRPAAQRILDALHTQVGLESHAEVARRIADAEDEAIPGTLTEARTRVAEADRFFQEMAVEATEADGDDLLRVYVGPDDAVTRDFCDALVSRAFTLDQIQGLSNGQTPTHPIHSGGGYNCRHSWLPVHPDDLELLGYQRGTDADIERANSAARRRKRKRRTR